MKKIVISTLIALVSLCSAPAAFANETVALMKEFYEKADKRPFNLADLTPYYSDDYVDHHPNPAMPADGPMGLVFKLIADGAPDSSHKIEMIIPSGDDKAIVVWSHEGTNTNNLFGIPTQTPALPFAIDGIEIWKSKDGKITDLWHVEDIAGLMAQLAKK